MQKYNISRNFDEEFVMFCKYPIKERSNKGVAV